MSPFAPQPVNRLRQQVEEQILEAIITRQLGTGDKLPSEMELADRFRVSRATIREALRSLESTGFIEKVPGARGGSFIRELDADGFGDKLAELINVLLLVGSAGRDEVAAVREMLEVPACRLAAENRTDEQVRQLHAIIEQQKARSVADADVPALDVDFHGAIAEASGNRILFALVRALHSVSKPVQHVELSKAAGRETVKQHLDVVRAIEARDPDAAEAAIRGHLGYLAGLQAKEQRKGRAGGPAVSRAAGS
jgi:DNA-binding FadR family transcriptional regulator